MRGTEQRLPSENFGLVLDVVAFLLHLQLLSLPSKARAAERVSCSLSLRSLRTNGAAIVITIFVMISAMICYPDGIATLDS